MSAAEQGYIIAADTDKLYGVLYVSNRPIATQAFKYFLDHCLLIENRQ